MVCAVQLQMNGLAFSHICDTKCYHKAKQNITLVQSYCIRCDLSLDRIYFSITNRSYPSISAVLQAVSLEFIQQVQWSNRCPKHFHRFIFSNLASKLRSFVWIILNLLHLNDTLTFFTKKEFTKHRTLPVGRVWNDSHFVYSQKFIHTKSRQNTNLAPIHTQFILSFKTPWTDQNEVPNMLPTPQIVTLIFLRMSPLGQATFSSVLVINEHSILATYQTGSHNFLQKLLSSFQSSCGIFPPTLNQNLMQAHCSCKSAAS
jgi:hypothetical protein